MSVSPPSQIFRSGHHLIEGDDSPSGAETPEAPSTSNVKLESNKTKETRDLPINGRLAVEVCRAAQSSSEIYYAFQITETVVQTVRLKSPQHSCISIECSRCGLSQGCRHTMWLVDQIKDRIMTEAEKSNPTDFPKREIFADVPHPYGQISNIGLNQLAQRAGWLVEPEVETHGDAAPDRPERGLDVMDTDATSVNPPAPPPVPNPTDWFIEKRIEADLSLSTLVAYIKAGPGASGQAHDIPWCDNVLRGIIKAIRNKILHQKLAHPAKQEAVHTLIHILEEAVSWNFDIYDDPVWRSRTNLPARDRDKNLYDRLINAANPADGALVLYELECLADAMGQILGRLESTFEMVWRAGAPAGYMNRFRMLLGRVKDHEAKQDKLCTVKNEPE